MNEMQRHPGLGADVIARFAAYGDGWRLVRHHHERWDGNGYPDGLAGQQIPLGARILAVADTYDALTSARPYREAKSPAFAIKVLTDGAGTQWEPQIVEALLAHLGVPAPQPQPEPAPNPTVPQVA
jgi:HD-GYP domain-containing protein (c-di-GMP phosphodiesterase class II)